MREREEEKNEFERSRHLNVLEQDQQTFSVNVQRINILGFVGQECKLEDVILVFI